MRHGAIADRCLDPVLEPAYILPGVGVIRGESELLIRRKGQIPAHGHVTGPAELFHDGVIDVRRG